MTSSTNRASLIERLEACHIEFCENLPVGYGEPFNPDGPEAAAMIREMDELLFDSLYHLRVDEAAKAYHEKVEALRKASQ